VVIELERVAPQELPRELAIAAVTLAELAAGPHATGDPIERARRQERLQRAEAVFDAVPSTPRQLVRTGASNAQTMSAGHKARGTRALDLLIAATALAADLPLYTRNASDFIGLEDVVDVVAVSAQ
jgi:hypothetical protein